MRQIKFRAWNKDSQEWVSNETEQSQTKLNYDTNFLVKWHVYELMQFTGLADKNGKEIYEGDILQASESIVKIQYSGRGFEGIYLNKSQLIESPLHNNNYLYWTVIGNIHSNPELLTSK